jgi:hypothetical protein
MKNGQEAQLQYAQLASAMRDVGAGWVVDEVEEVIARGKAIAFRDLPEEEQARYVALLTAESRKGLSVGKAKAGDQIGVAFEPDERLTLLVDATERVVTASALSHADIARFASEHGLQRVILEEPAGVDTPASAEEPHEVPMAVPTDVEGRLTTLRRILRDEVLE